jgi:MSHA biogenesis protein MshE
MASKRLGEILMEHGIITDEQLNEALRMQESKGGLLGIILVEMGYLKPKTLADFLESQRKS